MAVVNIMNLVQSLFAAVLLVKAQIPVTQVRIHPSHIRYRVGLLFMHKNSDFDAIGIFFLAKAIGIFFLAKAYLYHYTDDLSKNLGKNTVHK